MEILSKWLYKHKEQQVIANCKSKVTVLKLQLIKLSSVAVSMTLFRAKDQKIVAFRNCIEILI